MLANSIGSPTGVPVPCASTIPTVPASTPAAASAARYTAACASPEGIAMFMVWPSWLAAVARITPRIRSPSRCASARRLSSSTTQPSPDTKPSALTSNAKQCPVPDSMPPADAEADLRGSIITLTPPANASLLSPSLRLRQAWWMAYSPEEQAVSTVEAGPCSPRA